MKKLIPLLSLLIMLLGNECKAQWRLAPIIGFQADALNNNKFKQINTAIAGNYALSKRFELVFQLQRSWPLSLTETDTAFTQDPTLPLYASAAKTLRPSSWSLSTGVRFVVAGKNKAGQLAVLAATGIAIQKIKIAYQYDKNNYTILNPDKTQQRTGVFFSWGLEYSRQLKNGRAFMQLNFTTPPLGKAMNYPSSFEFMAPLSLNLGYAIPLKKINHEN